MPLKRTQQLEAKLKELDARLSATILIWDKSLNAQISGWLVSFQKLVAPWISSQMAIKDRVEQLEQRLARLEEHLALPPAEDELSHSSAPRSLTRRKPAPYILDEDE